MEAQASPQTCTEKTLKKSFIEEEAVKVKSTEIKTVMNIQVSLNEENAYFIC